MSSHLKQWHITQLETTRCEFETDRIVRDWIVLRGEANPESIKLSLGQDLIGLNKLVSEHLTQFNLFARPRESAIL